MPASERVPQDSGIKEFDARTAELVVGGDNVSDIESVGFDRSKNHELQYTVDQNAVWVKGTPEMTGSFVLKATSPSIPDIESAFATDEVFDINITLSEDAYGGDADTMAFVGCMITDISHSDYQIDDMPTVSIDFQAVNEAEG